MKGLWLLPLLALNACAVMERELSEAVLPWGEVGYQSLAVLPLADSVGGWSVAYEAQQQFVLALERAVAIVPKNQSDAQLVVHVVRLIEKVEAGSPRRVASQAWPAPAHYEADATTQVQLELSAHVEKSPGQSLWAATGQGKAERAHVVVLNHPAIDSLPAPAFTPQVAPDVEVVAQLRKLALSQAIAPLLEALSTHYRLKPFNESRS